MPFFFPQAQQQEQGMDIFQLLSLLDQPECGPRRQHKPQQTFTPRFDIIETGSAYELFGEVPGLDQKTLDIQFEDAQTLVLRGRTARPSASSTVIAEEKAVETPKEQEKENHNATVEDEYDEVDTPLTTSSPSTTATATEEKKPAAAAAPKPKYWVAERKVGNFARSFSFSQRIEIDDVTAELKEGVLHIVVPKNVKSKKVAVSVN